MQCPHCRTTLEDAPDLAGTSVFCPQCQGVFQVPGRAVAVLPPMVRPESQVQDWQQSPPVNILVTGQPRERRLGAGGWFTRAFTTTAGVVISLIVILAVVGFVATRTPTAVRQAAQDSRDERTAKKYAMQHLQGYGVRELAKDVSVVKTLTGYSVGGVALGGDGRTRKFLIVFGVGRFKDADRWEVESVMFDDDLLKGGRNP